MPTHYNYNLMHTGNSVAGHRVSRTDDAFRLSHRENAVAIHLYQRVGMHVEQTYYTYHKHISLEKGQL